jgi:hypothetical protein
MAKQYPKSTVKKYWVHKLDPLDILTPRNAGGSDDINYAIRRCKELAEADKGKDYLVIYRVLEHRGEVLFLSLVNFDEVTHYDMREAKTDGNIKEKN